jgi:hypothetical protein
MERLRIATEIAKVRGVTVRTALGYVQQQSGTAG